MFRIAGENVDPVPVRHNGIALAIAGRKLCPGDVFVEVRILREGETSFLLVMAEVPNNFFW